MTIPDPYARSVFRDKPLDNATIARLKQVEGDLGYELTVVQGIGGASASAGTHVEGRAVDLAPYDQAKKVRALRDRGFAAWYRPAVSGLWPAHVHGVLIFDGRDNHRGIAETAWRQIGYYDAGLDGLSGGHRDPNPYRPSPSRGFSMEDYRKTFDKPEPKPRFKKLEVVTFNPWVGNKNLRGNLRQLLEDTGRPVGLALQEMKGEDKLDLRGYTRIEADRKFHPHPEDRSNLLFVRNRGVDIIKTGVVDIADYSKAGWKWGPKGEPKDVWHPPKVFPWARVDADGQECVILAGHRVVAGFGMNQVEWRAEHRALIDFFDRRGKASVVAAMDWNDSPGDGRPLGVNDLAKRVRARLEIIGIDGGMVASADGTNSHKLEEGYGSDGHRPVVITVKKEIR